MFVIDLASRRVQIVGSTPHADDLFMRQVGRTLTAADEGVLVGHRVLICDRDAKWSAPVRERLHDAGIRVVQTPFQAPNANAYAERFVRSIKSERLDRMILLGEDHLRRTLAEFVEHYHRERNHTRARREESRRCLQRIGPIVGHYGRTGTSIAARGWVGSATIIEQPNGSAQFSDNTRLPT